MLRKTSILGLACLLAGWALSLPGLAQEAPPPPPPPPDPAAVKQVIVSVKIVEFQTNTGTETGLSAYFEQRNKQRAFGRVTSGNGNIRNADITFPTTGGSAITVFLDQIRLAEGDIEMVLQALVDQNRAFILSQPKAMVTVGAPVPTTIQTTQRIPYENTVVVGTTTVQTTAFRDTGVQLSVTADEVADDDGNPNSSEDTYIRLRVSAMVNEEGQRIVVALANQTATTGAFSSGSNAIRVPEFVSRSVATSVWVRHGQVLLLGGLFRNTKNKNLSTLPWLLQGESMALGLAQRVIPGAGVLGTPLSSSIGDNTRSEGRRELVFLIKAELWRPAYTVATGIGNGGAEDQESKKKVSLPGMFEDISQIPQGIVEGIIGLPAEEGGIESTLGGDE